MSRGEKRRLMRDKCARKWQIPFSEKTSLSRGTIGRWCRLYKDSNGDLKSLYPTATLRLRRRNLLSRAI
jgi:hypothetical protein